MELLPLTAISPIDGRYAAKTQELRETFSEYALIFYRVKVEIAWFEALAQQTEIKELPPLSEKARTFLHKISDNFNLQDAQHIKAIEGKINHDVKAVEYFLQEKFAELPELADKIAFIHFACTSEDINNLAYALMLKTAREQYLLPATDKLILFFKQFAKQYIQQPMLSRTHGQPATPTTLGKEFANIAARLQRQQQQIAAVVLMGKCNGAVGNYNAHIIAYPEVDWVNLSQQFIKNLGLECNLHTTQIEPHDFIAELSDAIARFNTVLIDTARDIWSYISLGYFKLKMKAEEVGSSTMPHKINPIDFENAEGNLLFANSMLQHFSAYLPRSRWQRDLRDSTLLRNLGVAMAHTLLGYKTFEQGLNKLAVDSQVIEQDLNQHWEILTEAVQTVLRRYQAESAYEQLKEFSRGKAVDQKQLQQFIHSLKIPEAAKKQLLQLTPSNYLGLAIELTRKI